MALIEVPDRDEENAYTDRQKGLHRIAPRSQDPLRGTGRWFAEPEPFGTSRLRCDYWCDEARPRWLTIERKRGRSSRVSGKFCTLATIGSLTRRAREGISRASGHSGSPHSARARRVSVGRLRPSSLGRVHDGPEIRDFG